MEVFDLKIRASIAVDGFNGLHNDEYKKFQLCDNCVISWLMKKFFGVAKILDVLKKYNFLKS